MSTEIYEKNMVAIRESQPPLAKWIEDAEIVDWVKQEGNQLKVMEQGRFIDMYDADPFSNLEELVKQAKGDKERVTVVIGLGLGHAVNAILGKMEKGHHVIVVEPVGHIVRLMLGMYDVSEHIESHSLIIAPGRNEVDYIFSLMESIKVVEDWNVLVEKVTRARPEYWKLTNYCIEALNQVQCNTGTVMSAGAKIADNDIATLPYVIRHSGVNDLKDLFKGKPAVMVGTGPSLSRNIHLLKDAQDKVVIVAVAQALRPLLAYGIRPDFICTVDFGEVNMTHLAGLLDETVPLVTINKAYAPMLKAYRGPKFISASINPGYDETAHGILKSKGELAQGGSVAHMAYSLCHHMGCSPVMFVGMNLALGTTSHFMQADSAGHITVENGQIKWVVDDPRSKTLHGRIDIGMGPETYAQGWWGDTVLTNTGLLTFITAFERLIESFGVLTLDCTEGGARKRGSKRMFLSDALAKYATDVVDKSVLTPLLTLDPKGDETIARLLPLLATDIKLLKLIIEHSELGLKSVLKLRNTNSQKKLLKLFHENAKHSTVANEAARRMPTVSLAIYGASRAIQGRALNVEANAQLLATKKFAKERAIRLDRNEIILKAARDAAKDLKTTYEETRNTLVEYGQGKTGILDSTGDPNPPNLDDADHYLDTGAFAKPYLEAQRMIKTMKLSADLEKKALTIISQARNIRAKNILEAETIQAADIAAEKNKLPEYLDLTDAALDMGRDEKKFNKALELLEQARNLQPRLAPARWGCASAYNMLNRLDEAKKEYEMLIKDFPENARYKFEYGQLLVRIWPDDGSIEDLRKAVEYISAAMKNTDEFDHFLLTYAAILKRAGNNTEAMTALTSYKEKYPSDGEAVWENL